MKYCALISGEHVELARAELESLCRMLPFQASITWNGRLASILADKSPTGFLLGRAALVQEAGVVLAESNTLRELIEGVSPELLRENLSSEMSFAVRTTTLEEETGYAERQATERNLGTLVMNTVESRVDLKNPDKVLKVFLMSEKCVLCCSDLSPLRPVLREREPGKKAFFHPSMMNAFLSRVMCNLVAMLPGDIVLDPFCGGGGILCEAAHIGAKTVGVDLNWNMLRGAHENLSQITSDVSLIQGDACELPVIACDCLVTDPPYGRASSTRGVQSRDLLYGFVSHLDEIVKREGETICICCSAKMDLPNVVRELGYTVGRHLTIHVHSGLVREIVTVVV